MKLLWSGEEVNFDGQYWHIHGARMAITPMQQPHPPIWFASHSPRATRRAANAADGCLLGPQTAWEDISSLASIYWETREASDRGPTGMLGMHRAVAMSTNRETAASEARAVGERKGAMYGGWGMQENSVVDLGLDRNRPIHEWTIIGSPEECLETLVCRSGGPSPVRRPHLHQLPRRALSPHGNLQRFSGRGHPQPYPGCTVGRPFR